MLKTFQDPIHLQNWNTCILLMQMPKAMAIISVDGQNASGSESDATSGGVGYGGLLVDLMLKKTYIVYSSVLIGDTALWSFNHRSYFAHIPGIWEKENIDLFKDDEQCLQYILI